MKAQAKWLENTRDFPSFIIKRRPVGEKTVSKAERAWFLSCRERRAKPVSERDFLAGKIPRVLEPTDRSVHGFLATQPSLRNRKSKRAKFLKGWYFEGMSLFCCK